MIGGALTPYDHVAVPVDGPPTPQPAVAILFLQRFYVEGLARGAVKG